jgi:hypothetical protein
VYYLAIPATFLILVINSVCNLNVEPKEDRKASSLMEEDSQRREEELQLLAVQARPHHSRFVWLDHAIPEHGPTSRG